MSFIRRCCLAPLVAFASLGCRAAADAPCAASWYVTQVASIQYRPHCDGGDGHCFGSAKMPGVVEGPPKGAGVAAGSTDVVSLGQGGVIVVGFDRTIVDGPGPDFFVFENPFYVGGDPAKGGWYELGAVAVSSDGQSWRSFPCTATQDDTPPFGSCAGWHPVLLNSDDAATPPDPATCGGDPYDLHDLGVSEARFVEITDRRFVGRDFDLDAVGIVNAAPDCQ